MDAGAGMEEMGEGSLGTLRGGDLGEGPVGLPPYLGSPELVRGVTGPEPTDTLAAPTDPSCQARGLCRPSWVGDEVKTGMGKHLTPSDSAQTPTHSP
jgi:hypothetical protein